MSICIYCNSTNLKKLGMRFMGKDKGLGFKCNDCGESYIIPDLDEADDEIVNDDLLYVRSHEYIEELKKASVFVFTSAVNDAPVVHKFLKSLENYCDDRQARLVVFPLRYRNPSLMTILNQDDKKYSYPDEIQPYLVENNFEIADDFRVLGSLKTQATAENPLSGIDGLSKGSSIILGHPQVALKTLPRNSEKYPAIATTTGAVTEKFYSTTKMGYKASHNHSLSAVVVEIDHTGDIFVRHLNFDGTGFYDIDKFYHEGGIEVMEGNCLGLVTGDEHAIFSDKSVIAATYFNNDSIVNVLKPQYIVRHDVLDFFSASHHHKKDVFLRYAKHHSGGMSSVRKELLETIGFIDSTTPSFATNIMIASNHNEHLRRWLNEANPKEDPENALLYHELMYKMLLQTEMGETTVSCPEPFELFARDYIKSNTMFLSRHESFKIGDIEISNHGDVGASGSRGSSKQFSNVPAKTITGHSHSPVIDKGNYTVGTSSRFDLSYVSGLSSWHHAHCIIYPNGKRQMLFIVNGKWRRIN